MKRNEKKPLIFACYFDTEIIDNLQLTRCELKKHYMNIFVQYIKWFCLYIYKIINYTNRCCSIRDGGDFLIYACSCAPASDTESYILNDSMGNYFAGLNKWAKNFPHWRDQKSRFLYANFIFFYGHYLL